MQLTFKNSLLLLLTSFTIYTTSFSQLPKRVEKLVGTWNYQGGSGYEVFVIKNRQLHGESYLRTKVGLTYYVENILVKFVNKKLVYETIPVRADSLIENKKSTFISEGKRMKFVHTENTYPAVVKYKIGCLTKNKLKISIYPTVADQKKKVLRLTRSVDGTL